MLSDQLEQLIGKAIQKVTGKKPESVHLEPPANADFGDFSTNTAMALSKELGKNPRDIAQELIDALPKNDIITKTDIAGPGFVNFWLSEKVYEEAFVELNKKIDQEEFGQLDIGKGKIALTDSSHPNVAKKMGVHNVLSTIIGHALNNLLKIGGYQLTRDNYLGDWGTQFGKLIYAYNTWGDHDVVEKDPIPELQKLYVKFHDEVEQDDSLEDRGREEFKKLEDGDKTNRQLWEWICELSMTEFNKIYDRLGVSFDMIHGESYYEDKMQSIIDDGLKSGVITEGEKGALIVEMENEDWPPLLIRKSDGATTYATRDLARVKDWKENYEAEVGIIVVDIAQKLHHQQVEEAAEKLGINYPKNIIFNFGRMQFPEGGMSTRKGKVIFLEDVLNEAEKRALEKIKEHDSELPEEEQTELARIIGLGAFKYNILSQNPNKNYTFDWDIMLSFDGNSAPYLQYAYTRTQSILKKADQTDLQATDYKLQASEEQTLLKKLLGFETAIGQSLETYKPSTLCTYLFELAQAFSQFYNNLRVLDAEPTEVATRLKLVEDTAYVLKKGLDILGIEVPARM